METSYSVFSETALKLIGTKGQAGMVLPTGIATDEGNKEFFAQLVEENRLVSLFDFENKEGIFPQVAVIVKFCLLTFRAAGKSVKDSVAQARFAFFLHSVNDLKDERRQFGLTTEDFALINPNTKTSPVFHSSNDAKLIKRLYTSCPVLVNESRSENSWLVTFRQGLFNMTSDSNLFVTRNQLDAQDSQLAGNIFRKGRKTYLPLYEAKFIQQFDHRHGSFEYIAEDRLFKTKAGTNAPEAEQKSDPNYVILPRFWVEEEQIEKAVPESWQRRWFIAFRNIIQPMTNARCAIFSIIPFVAVGNSTPLLFTEHSRLDEVCCLLGCLNSFVVDYVTRQKMGGGNFNFFIVKQLPVLPPSAYTPADVEFIAPRVLELVYTAWDIKAFADDVWKEANSEWRIANGDNSPLATLKCTPKAGQAE